MSTWICEVCGAQASRRGTKPGRFCSRRCADVWSARDIPDAEVLRAWYWDEKLSCVDIGRMVNRDPKRVHDWLRKAGIPTRPRGAESGHSFQPGQVSAFMGKTHTPEARARFRAARLADGRVPYLRNGEHYLKGVTGPAHPNWKGGTTPERQAFHSSKEWKATARAVWVRDQSTCQRCGCRPPRKGPKHNRGHVHHIVSFQVRELRTAMSNLVPLCADCHRWVHSRANTLKEYIAS